MMLKVFTSMVLGFCSMLLGATGLLDPVVLENDFLKLTVDRGRGATLRSMIDKRDGSEAAREFLSGKYWSGALAEDRLANDPYPGEITRLIYSGNLQRLKHAQMLKLISRQESGSYQGWEFSKTYMLRDDARFVDVTWRIANIGQQKRTITPWVHNIINKQFHNTVLPKNSGVKLIPPSADYFNTPARNWLGGYNPEHRRLIYFSADYQKILKHYYCFWNQYHALEWTFRAVDLLPGSLWTGTYRIGLASPENVPVAISRDLIVSYQWSEHDLNINLEPTARLDNVEVRLLVNGVEVTRQNVTFKLDQARFNLKVPADTVTAPGLIELKIYQDGKERLQFQPPSPNPLLFSVDYEKHRGCSEFPLLPWPSPESPYAKMKVQRHPAQIYFRGAKLSVGEISAYEKFFARDLLTAGKCKVELRSLRNSRAYRQLILRNDAARPVTVEIQPESCSLKQGSEALPVSVRQVGYVRTKDPSAFLQQLPVGRYPDPLLPIDKFRVRIPAHESVPLFLEIVIPAQQPSGTYEGAIAMTSLGRSWKIPVTCQVMVDALPPRSFVRSTLGCWGVASSVLQEVGYKGGAKQFQKACQALCYQNRLTPRENGIVWSVDSKMDEQLKALKRCHVTSIVVPSFVVKNDQLFPKAVDALKRHGLYRQAFYYTIDEAPQDLFPKVKAECQEIHRKYPDFKILGTIYEKDVSFLFGEINIWCRAGIAREAWHQSRRRLGDEIMSSNLPKTYLETAGIDPLVTFLDMKQCDYAGFLYWNIIGGYGKDNPWKNISCAGVNGNAHLLYPHRSGPLETLRWKYIAHGVELYDQLTLLQQQQPQVYRELIETSRSIRSWRQLEDFRSAVLNHFH